MVRKRERWLRRRQRNLSRRILVMREGICSGEVERENFSEAGLMRMMAGVRVEENAPSFPAGAV